MKITERLKVEHGVFLHQIKLLERLAAAGAPAPVLATAVETLAVAEEPHSEIEERLLYPLLEASLGAEFPALKAVAGEHARLRELLAKIRGGAFAASDVSELARFFRQHLENEIHSLFVLAEEWIPESQLVAMCDWEGEHVYDSVGRREDWMGAMEKKRAE